MTRLAADQLGLGDRAEALDIELRREGRSYTSDTLKEIHRMYPDAELWLLMGTDMFLTLQAWHEPGEIFDLAGIAAFGRTEEDTEELFAVQRKYLYTTYPNARIFTLTIPGVVEISSTELREKLAAEAMGRRKYDPEEFREKVTEIRVPENGRLIFVFRDGHTVEKQHGFEWPDGRRCHICQQ